MNDFPAFLAEIGLTQAQMDAAAASMPRPLSRMDAEDYFVAPSEIQGFGCFALKDIDGLIARLRTGDDWHEAGRFINHSATPNAVASMQDGNMVAHGNVARGDEITLDYRQVRDCVFGESHG